MTEGKAQKERHTEEEREREREMRKREGERPMTDVRHYFIVTPEGGGWPAPRFK